MTQPYVFDWHTAPPRPRRSLRWHHHVALLCAAVLCVVLARSASGQEAERFEPSSRGGVRAIIVDRAEAHGVAAGPLIALAQCESRLDPGAVGDHGSSHGLVQLSDLSTGLLWDFYRRGYTNAYDPWEAADYLAAVSAGEYAGIRLSRWSCWGGW